MNARKQFSRAYGITLTAGKHRELLILLVCLEVVLAFSYLGFIELPPISVTTLSVLVVVAAMYFGPEGGAVIALVFAGASVWKASTTSVEEGDLIFSPFFSGKPLESLIMAVLTRVLFGLAAGLLYRWFFSRERKYRKTGIAVIALASTMLHALLVYACMAGFFGAAEADMSAGFDRELLISNLILYTVTVLVTVGCDKLMQSRTVSHFIRVTAVENIRLSREQKNVFIAMTAAILAICILICIHFMSRITGYVTLRGDVFDSGYVSWFSSLLLQFVIGFAAAFGLIAMFFRWMQQYFSVLSMDVRRDESIREELIQNNARIFALEDDFESLYDVDMESGHYMSYVKGDFYQSNVIDHLVTPSDYFEDLRANIDAVICEEDRDGLYSILTREAIRRELAENDHFDYYYRVNTAAGPVWFRIRIVYKNADKKNVIIGVFNAENDVQARQIAEQQARLNENMQMVGGLADRYDTLYYVNMDEGSFRIYALDGEKFPETESIVNQFTDPFEAIRRFGTSPIVHPEDRALFAGISADNVRERLTHSKKFSLRYRQADGGGDFVWFEMEVIKYEKRDERANVIAVGFANRDREIRAEQVYHRQLEEARSAAEAANRSKTDFLFSMSHDIRTPMNAITGFTGMAIRHIDDKEKTLDCLNKIQQSGNMLLSLINSVLEVSRIESGHAVLQEQPGDIMSSFVSIENTMHELAETKDIALVFTYGEIRDRYVYADFTRCMRIFVNIISNAIKYTPEGGHVSVRCEQMEETPSSDGTALYRYTFTDDGIGMSEEFQKHVFEQFTRETTATVSGVQGTGLGMSVVRSFVELMGGTVSVQSRQGVGTTFTVILPFRLRTGPGVQTAPVTGQAEAAAKPGLAGKRVLLVEDNELNREIAVEILEEEGLTVWEAWDGTVAVAEMRDKGPDWYDFILMDIQMPRMNGYEATRAIRAMYPDAPIPIIALSANAFEEDRQKSLEAGMNDHVAKPINIQELLAVLTRYLPDRE